MRNEFILYIDNIDHASIFRLKYHFPIFYIQRIGTYEFHL